MQPQDSPVTPASGPLAELLKLVDAALALEIHVTDEPGSLALAAISAPLIIDLLDRAINLLQKVHHLMEVPSNNGQTEPGSLDDIGAMISTAVASQEIQDLAFIARAQLRRCRGELAVAIGRQSLLNIVAGSDAAICRLRKGLIPIEAALSEFVGARAPARDWTDTEILRASRRLYARLGRELNAVGSPDDEDLPARLAEFAERLAEVRSSEVYTFLRINDRVQIRSLFKRIKIWLDDPQSAPADQGRRIWSDLATFVALLGQINNRQELQEHDRRIIDRVWHALYASVRPPKLIPGPILDELRALEGRDQELDRLILQAASRDPRDWEAPIRRLWETADEPTVERRIGQGGEP